MVAFSEQRVQKTCDRVGRGVRYDGRGDEGSIERGVGVGAIAREVGSSRFYRWSDGLLRQILRGGRGCLQSNRRKKEIRDCKEIPRPSCRGKKNFRTLREKMSLSANKKK